MGSPHHITKGHEYEAILPWLQEGLLVSTGEQYCFDNLNLLLEAQVIIISTNYARSRVWN